MSAVVELAPYQEPTCECRHVDIRALTCSNGAIQYVKQCLACGEKVGTNLKKEDAFRARGDLQFILPFDTALRDDNRAHAKRERDQFYESRRARMLAQHQGQQQEFDAWYAEYLKTESWAKVRAKVMARAGGRCEGCADTGAQVVHHLNYDHVGNELLFELVALCRDCHDKAHGKGRWTQQ